MEAATALIEREGRAGFSLRGVAAETGHSTSSIYTHFDSVAELLDAVALAYLDGTVYPPPARDPLLDLENFTVSDLRRALNHPEIAALVVERRTTVGGVTRATEYLEGLLRRAGVGRRMTDTVLSTLGLLTLGAFANMATRPHDTLLRQFRDDVRLVLAGVTARSG